MHKLELSITQHSGMVCRRALQALPEEHEGRDAYVELGGRRKRSTTGREARWPGQYIQHVLWMAKYQHYLMLGECSLVAHKFACINDTLLVDGPR